MVAYFKGPRSPRFFVTADEAPARARAIADCHPHLAARTLGAAQAALDHIVDLLGSGPVPLGPDIDWQRDFKTGYRWPTRFYEDVDYVALDKACDIKVPWELSRGYHLVTLGRAYALDANPRYALEVVRQLEQWIAGNPWPYGVNWGRSMEVAVRAVNWVWAIALVGSAPEFHDHVRPRVLKSLLQHGRHILDNLEYGGKYSGNHYLSNGVGLLFLGILYPEFVEAEAWLRKGQEIVFGEMPRQVFADGVDFEMGIGYQGLVAEFWYTSLLLCDLNGVPVPEGVRARLEKMFDFMLAYTRPDGTFPQVGDNDDGRLAGLDDEAVGTHRRHLAVGGAVFRRPDLLAAGGDAVETAVWLCGTDVLHMPRQAARPGSLAFPHGGFYVLRQSDAHMLVDAGSVGLNGIGGHGHNDLLSFDLWAGGAPLLSDSGTYVYTADPAARQTLRATAAHNAMRVDGQEIARMGGVRDLWLIQDDAHPTVHRWESNEARDVLDVEHDGYRRLPQPVIHRRLIRFYKHERAWVLDDLLTGDGEHLAELFLHPGVPVVEQEGLSIRLSAPEADLWIVALSLPRGTTLERDAGWLSRGYGHREPATVLRYAVRGKVPLRFVTGLALVPPTTPLHEARSILEALSWDTSDQEAPVPARAEAPA